jgi:hypothetical protein
MEDEAPTHPKGETRSKVTQKNQVDLKNGTKGRNNRKWGQGKLGPLNNKEKSTSHQSRKRSKTCPRSNVSIVTTMDI